MSISPQISEFPQFFGLRNLQSMQRIIDRLELKVPARELMNKDWRAKLAAVMGHWMPLAQSVLGMDEFTEFACLMVLVNLYLIVIFKSLCQIQFANHMRALFKFLFMICLLNCSDAVIRKLPSPVEAQSYRVPQIWPTAMLDAATTSSSSASASVSASAASSSSVDDEAGSTNSLTSISSAELSAEEKTYRQQMLRARDAMLSCEIRPSGSSSSPSSSVPSSPSAGSAAESKQHEETPVMIYVAKMVAVPKSMLK